MHYERPDGHTFSFYLHGGDGTRRVDGAPLCGRPGALCIMPQGASSEWEITERFEFVHLYIADDELCRLFSETFDRDARLMILPEATFDEAPAVAFALSKLATALQSNHHVMAEEASVSMAYQIFADPRYGGQKQFTLRGGLAPQVRRRLFDYIEAELHRQISLRELACTANLSEFHLQRMFKQSCGVSPHSFILNRRIEKARRMLASAEPIAEIAAACGFSHQSHLTRAFKTMTGITPFAYRLLSNGNSANTPWIGN
ncbi:AraC family transcriptional regulator [Rhizobium sp. FKY42]|uniref:helix-turn-helix transcriptional regulator n=1 Tax=Rhizobium sp. FKY42 TaxID=2562310 RepID=UPI0010BF7B00|nr:AraC family transcriptional regulator [Rhizobium sp. FKY42]